MLLRKTQTRKMDSFITLPHIVEQEKFASKSDRETLSFWWSSRKGKGMANTVIHDLELEYKATM